MSAMPKTCKNSEKLKTHSIHILRILSQQCMFQDNCIEKISINLKMLEIFLNILHVLYMYIY